ncbi:pyridoxamine 5'-phosphate oxidase family protein [Neolewinella lacunae]|uniref:Pyridoxamine 5'-phosphate oxidase family protein n=1 Tax=Neolewinella lacunae TaxID=1517758 RepID=A0A923PRL2_9BACT|nr:pyridoxamine 5'-phosphate oxidase family protein [Neolewinella lacunae]MBC6996183.1 pyridoxamine 5'-phosphate oxidase family protein [Neolewinella lacunae]MDN3635357.1 pyridoxamine 5'-phosphate oxidase family protein [Neolewinella lacunae]
MSRTTPSRYPKRAHHDAATIYPILDEALFCTMSFVSEGRVRSIPQSLLRLDHALYFHASVGSHFFRSLAGLEEVCITVTLADAIVVAKTAFNHSINYRSVVLWGQPEVVDDPAEKYAAFRALTEKMVPGSWDYLLPMTEKEMAKTMALKVPIAEASAKIRQGPPSDSENDAPLWTGLIPIQPQRGRPQPGPEAGGIALPRHLE